MRWINPDEGAHLMDARLLLEGFLPIVDYGARQPVYVGLLAGLLKLFGNTLSAGRLLPVLSSMAGGAVLFMIGKRLYNPRAGLVAGTLYLFLPLTMVWSPVVKTEPLTIALTSLAVLFVLDSIRQPHRLSMLFIGGVFAGCAFYVRQPSLYIPIAAVLFFATAPGYKHRARLTRIIIFAGGFLRLSLLPSFYFTIAGMTVQEFMASQLNPLYLIWNRVPHLFNMLPDQYKVVDSSGFRVWSGCSLYTPGLAPGGFLFSVPPHQHRPVDKPQTF
ncbi:MAG: glycosyltransferase family 39 protein [candidate division KSB1 bacterium]|nr:glycosyltransferase family 39 protein [candidate division KSB1 bacterium]